MRDNPRPRWTAAAASVHSHSMAVGAVLAIERLSVMQQSNPATDVVVLLRQRLPEMPMIVLSKEPELDSRVLDVQDYVVGGEAIIPLFSSPEALRASTRGVDLGRPLFKIDRGLLLSIAKDHTIYLLDPQTEEQLRFSTEDLRAAFPESFIRR